MGQRHKDMSVPIRLWRSIWVSQQMENKKGFLREPKQRLIDCNIQDRHDKISTKERFESYRGFKQIVQFESYLSYLSQKILGSHISNTLRGK